jgi:DNA (cytosine-5)-methyltransferase 1
MIKAVSLFSGAGGMDVGFEKAGIDVVFANEIDKISAQTYSTNHPNTEIVVDDINNIYDRLESYAGTDIVFGGPPCQGFSVIGKMNPEDERSQLIWSFLKVVEIIRPKAFVMENVKALAAISKWRDVREEYIHRAYELGYGCVPFIVNAAEYGTPQKRERVFFIGIRDDYSFEQKMWDNIREQQRKAPVIRELFKDLGPAGTEKNPRTCNAKITFAVRPVIRRIPYDCLMFNGIGRPIDPDGYSRTITASAGGNMTLIVDEKFLHDPTADNWIQEYYDKVINKEIIPEFKEAPERLRRLTIRETMRLQTFPDNYVFCGPKSSVYKQLGNAVPCEMAKTIAVAVSNYISSNNI